MAARTDSKSSSDLERKLSTDKNEKGMAMVEQVHTNERVPGHTNYYEKDGLRTYGDDFDHDHEPPMTFRRFMSLTAMALLWTGSQIPVYLFGAVPPYIYRDIGGTDRWTWFVLANLLALASICPFVGSLSDLLGRRYVALMGGTFIVIGMIVCSTAQVMDNFIAGMAIAGVGAGINELTALAATSEMAPTSKRGKYVAVLIFTIVPFCPSVLWGQLIASTSPGGWRWIGLLCGVWAFIGTLLTAVFYFPPPRVNSSGMTRRQILAEIDYVGGFLSITGLLLFMCAMQWGGYQYPWGSAHVIAPLVIGSCLVIAFVVWEAKFAKHPMFPARLKQAPRTLVLTLIITFISGANFFSVLMFWPTQAFNVYGHDPVGVGIRGIPIGFSILAGACVVLVLLSVFKGANRELMIISSIFMTAGCGAMSAATPENLGSMWIVLVIAGFGIGGIVVPASIITTIICPDDLIATVAALTLAIRVLGGSIGYSVYYNVFYNKFVPNATLLVGDAIIYVAEIYDQNEIVEIVTLVGNSLNEEILNLPGIAGNLTKYDAIISAGQLAFSESYKYVYYVSIAFGVISIACSCFVEDIRKFMDDHVAVIIQ